MASTEEDDPEGDYYLKVLDVIKRQDAVGIDDLYTTILAMGATNISYLQTSVSLIKTGYRKGTDPFLIGMMHVTAIFNALKEGKDMLEYSIIYLQATEKNLIEGFKI